MDLKQDFAKKNQNFGWKKAFFDIFFCIIKQFHPPSWRLCGPETRFCEKISKFWLKKSLFLCFSRKIWPNLTFFCIIKHFHPPSWRLSGPETGFCKKKIRNFDRISSKFDAIWPNFDKISTIFDNFFCIIKHFHPPSWRLSGPETGFCKKKYQNFGWKKAFFYIFE